MENSASVLQCRHLYMRRIIDARALPATAAIEAA
jgi:hypothetical protein